ncbi:MAG TPA: vWA domain-containing protein [Anaerolineales bacterium]|nr:vWA domain-containing protein [Anaerolineales bacterium]
MAAPTSNRRWPVVVAVCCGVVAVCLCLTGAAAGGYYYFRGRPAAAEPSIEYILDASPRMESPSQGGDARLSVARGVLAEIVRTGEPSLTSGLRVFGTGALPQGCQDTDLVVPLAASNQDAIEGGLGNVAAADQSDSALAEAMVSAIKDLASTRGPQSLVVVTGGADTCNPEAADLVRQEADRAGIDLRMFVVGFEVPPQDAAAVKAFVGLLPGATYTEASNEDALRQALSDIQAQVDLTVSPPPARTSAGRTSANACDHPYLPLRSGSSWSFSTSEGDTTWSVTSASGSQDSASAVMDITVPDVSLTIHWTCTPQGIVSYDFTNFNVSGVGAAAGLDVTNTSGSWLPPADLLTPGYSWNNDFTTNVTISAAGSSIESSSTTSEAWTVAGVETVSVPAGTFDAVRIDGTATTTTTMSGPVGMSMPPVTIHQSFWLAEGVGPVRYTTSTEGYSGHGELTSYSVP